MKILSVVCILSLLSSISFGLAAAMPARTDCQLFNGYEMTGKAHYTELFLNI